MLATRAAFKLTPAATKFSFRSIEYDPGTYVFIKSIWLADRHILLWHIS